MSVKRNVLRVAATTVASGILATGALALASSASASTFSDGYSFTTLDNAHDLTFNQLLGINDEGVIAGYFGSGMAGHPNKGYVLLPPYRQHSYLNENFPGSVQTQVTGSGDVAGFYTASGGNSDGFLLIHHRHGCSFIDLAFPGASSTMALGVSSNEEVVGTYTDGSGNSATMHGFTWTPVGGFATVDDPNGVGTTTINGVNDLGDLVGFYVDGNGNTDGFVAIP